jgi:serine/threonine protein kinase
MNVFDEQGCYVQLGQRVAQGGEATIYRIGDQPARITKIYAPRPRPDYQAKLTWMIHHPPATMDPAEGHAALAWPDGLLFDQRGQLAGYTMPYIRAAVPLLEVFNPRLRALVLPRFDRRYLHRAARNLCAALGTLHAHGYVAGDINESNILVTPSALVTLIDTDSFQVEENQDGRTVLHCCPVGKPEYLPPELQGRPAGQARRTPAQDGFGLAVLIFQLLMDGNHPFRAQWLGGGDPPPIEVRIAQGAFPYTSAPRAPVQPPRAGPDLNRLHPRLAELMRRCFIEGHANPELRPSARAWEDALAEAEQALTVCPRGHIYSNHLRACPICPPPRAVPVSPPRPAGAPAGTGIPVTTVPRPQPAQAAAPQPAQARAAAAVPVNPRPVQPFPAKPRSTQPPPAARPAPTRPRSAPPPSYGFSSRAQPRPASMTSTLFRSWAKTLPTPRQFQLKWVAPRVGKSLAIGGSLGALAGAVPAGILAFASQPEWTAATFTLLFALGGAAGGLLRGWRPGYRLGAWMDAHMGVLFCQAIGMVLGVVLGFTLGMVFWWAIFPVVIGVILGAQAGAVAGKLVWQAGQSFGWRRIFTVLGGGGAALLGWVMAGWIASGGVGQLVSGWVAGEPLSVALTSIAVGAICGGLGGALAGATADLFGRLSGLVD